MNLLLNYFHILVISTFDVKIQPELEPVWVLTDNLNMPISKNQFENVLKTFHAGSMFFINADLQPTNIKGAVQIVTPMVKTSISLNHLQLLYKYKIYHFVSL